MLIMAERIMQYGWEELAMLERIATNPVYIAPIEGTNSPRRYLALPSHRSEGPEAS